MHPSANIEREYMVRVMGDVTEEMLKAMLDGVMLDDGVARFTDIQAGNGDGINRWYYVVLMEGRNREVRRLWESQGLTVSRLKRVRYGELFIPSKVKKGQWEELGAKDISTLYAMAGLPDRQPMRLTPAEIKKQERRSARQGRVRMEKRGAKAGTRHGGGKSDSGRKSGGSGAKKGARKTA
ncbi:unnamed protein product [Ectocarpus sp. 12 AP-2014]